MQKKVSVIVPIYNVEKYLRKCVESIVNQTYKNIEIILVDDGSTDNSSIICDELRKEYKNITVIHKKNGGLSSARNAGIDVATGEYISFIDSDDFIDLNMYSTMVDAISKSGKDISCSGRVVDIYGSHCNIEYSLDSQKEYTKEQAIKNILHFDSIDVSACDKLYNKKIFKHIRFPEGKISEDAAVIFEIIDASNGIIHVGKPFYHYIFRKKSISKSNYSIKNLDVIENLNNTKKFINAKYKKYIEDFKVYACITAAAQLIVLNGDKNARKQFKAEHQVLKEYFKDGYKNTMSDKHLSKRKKFELFCIKHKILNIYNLIKQLYQIKYMFNR